MLGSWVSMGFMARVAGSAMLCCLEDAWSPLSQWDLVILDPLRCEVWALSHVLVPPVLPVHLPLESSLAPLSRWKVAKI